MSTPAENNEDPAFVELLGITKQFGGVRALDHVDFKIAHGEVHCLVGENGSGKSTLIKILSGIHHPDAGTIRLDGTVYRGLSPAVSQRHGIQIIYQDLSLFPNLTVAENVGFRRHLGSPFRSAGYGALERRAREVAERIKVQLPMKELVGNLPIAARQLVAICRALAAEARLVVMDEPTASLTHTEVDSLLQTIGELRSQDVATIFVSHRLEEVMSVAQRVTILRDGKRVGVFPAAQINSARLAELMTGQKFDHQLLGAGPVEPRPVLEVRGLTRWGEFEDVSFELRPGEILGLTGRLGSGRTELALALFGLNPPDHGEVRLNGNPIHLRNNRDAVRHGIGYVSEDRLSLGLVMPQSIEDNTILTIMRQLVGRFQLINTRVKQRTVTDWIDQLKIKARSPAQPVRELSGGNQQRVVLAKWLATKPRILILDSPTVGVDVGAKSGIYEIIKGLARQGLAILFISDEVEEVWHETHRIMVMREGKIVATYKPGQVTEGQLQEIIHA